MTTDSEQKYNVERLAHEAFVNDKLIDIQSYNTKNNTPKRFFQKKKSASKSNSIGDGKGFI